MGIDDLLNGEELIIKQCGGIKELPSRGLKEYSPNNSWIEKKQIEKKLEEKFNFINTERIEKSNIISVAEWVPHLSKARVIKKNGKSWETIGHHQDNEDWLMPEEILFLVENSELQLILGNVSASIEDCYALLLQEKWCTLDEYRVYSYLSRTGFRVVRHSPSITVTPYEKQVNLDSVVQRHKRSPPRSSESQQNDCEVTIIDDDISILSPSVENVNKVVFNRKEKENADVIEVIEIDDDGDNNKVIEEVIDSSDDSSDIVCISSPSYVSTDRSRLWYPIIQKCLLRPMERIIDLCDDDVPNDLKSLIQNNLELIRASRAKVLSLLPSAENGVSVIHCPDSRLLPNNVVPRFSEYKVNLNVRSDYYASRNFNNEESPMPRMPLTNMINRANASLDFRNSPILRKAEEMQAMAVNMIQTAATLMSALGSQNPNELWNFVDGNNRDVPLLPKFNALQQQRPWFRFPRRYGRQTRKRLPRRYFNRTVPRAANNDNTAKVHSSPNIKPDIVVLSDDEGTDADGKRKIDEKSDGNSIKKQKREYNLDSTVILEDSSSSLEIKPNLDIKTNEKRKIDESSDEKSVKKQKGEDNLDSTVVLEDSSNSLETKPNMDINTKSEDPERAKNTNGHLKEENNASGCDNEVDVPLIVQDKAANSSQISSTSPDICDNSGVVKLVTEEKTLNETDCEKNQDNCCSNSHLVKVTSQDLLDQHGKEDERLDNEIDNVSKSCENENRKNQLLIEKLVSDEESLNVLESSSSCEKLHEGTVTCWEEYKNREDTQCNNAEESMEQTEGLIKFDACTTYENILKSLQIFNDVATPKVKKKFKVIYDVYLPETNFKKSLKILPNFRVVISQTSEELPSLMDLKSLKTEYQDEIPFLFSVVFNETVGFYFYDNVSIPTLSE